MLNKLKGLVKEEQGQGMTEYGLVLGLIAVAVVSALVVMREDIIAIFESAKDSISTGKDGLTGTGTTTEPTP